MSVYLLTGPTAAGKSTVAKHLASRLLRVALVEYDDIHRMFARPHVPPWLPEGFVQQALGVRMVGDIALRFLSDDYDVIITDVVSDRTASLYRESLHGHSLRIIQLLPDFDTLRTRFDARGPVLTDEEFIGVYREQAGFTRYDLRLDNSSLSAEAVAERILAL
jgi:predicted kinase